MPFQHIRRLALLFVAVIALLTGCTSGSFMLEIAKAAWHGTTSASGVNVLATPLNPSYRYLNVELAGQAPALLVLGYLDLHPLGDIEVWYSSEGEVLRLQNGRVVGSTGLSVDWLRVSYPTAPPSWDAVPADGATYTRVRDETPGSRYAIKEQVSLKPTTQPAVAPASPVHMWFSETYSNLLGNTLPGSLFGLSSCGGHKAIVYSRQCLSAGLCLTLQAWPPKKDCN
jgi:hypothetical protein